MSQSTALQRLLVRDRWVVGACLAGACLLAWLWLAGEAGSMAAMAGPGPAGGSMEGMGRASGPGLAHGLANDWAGAFVMWMLMMVAMMLPSAAPMILLYAAFARGVKAQGAVLAPTFAFAGVYGLLWTAFSAMAALAQAMLVRIGAVSAATLSLGGAWIAGGLLIIAGLYQLTPLKRACLAQCRSPLSFVTRFWRPGWAGAARLGLIHGAYCIGCCWLLMALLFVGGVMSLAWVAALALVVLAEKVAPVGRWGSSVIGIAAILAGAGVALGLVHR